MKLTISGSTPSQKNRKIYEGIIYSYTSPSKKIYIGQTINHYKNRAGINGANYKLCRLFWKAIQKYGFDSMVFNIIKSVECNSKEKLIDTLNKMEVYYINKYNSADKRYGYNIMYGGGSHEYSLEHRKSISLGRKGIKFTEEHIKHISDSVKLRWSNGQFTDERNAKVSLSNIGKPKSDLHRKHISQSKIGNKNPMFGKKPANYREDLNDDSIKTLYRSGMALTHIAKILGCGATTIKRRLDNIL